MYELSIPEHRNDPMARTTRVRNYDRPRDGKRDPRNRQRDDQRKAARRAKHTIQGRTR